MTTFRKPLPKRLADPDAEEVRRSHAQAIDELQRHPVLQTQIIKDVVIPNNGAVLVAHKLGRVPEIVLVSPERGAVSIGMVAEQRGGFDRSRFVNLAANGFGAAVTVDVEVK